MCHTVVVVVVQELCVPVAADSPVRRVAAVAVEFVATFADFVGEFLRGHIRVVESLPGFPFRELLDLWLEFTFVQVASNCCVP
jgi:hypothetical protein